jgi:uncharacterized protein (DUF2141 family)
MKTFRALAIPFLAAIVTAGSASAGQGGEVSIYMHGMRNSDGQALCALFRGAKGFPDGEAAIKGSRTTVKDGKASCSFKGVQPGTYAVGVIHDEDGDAEMDTVLGIPTEGFGFSNNAKPGMFGPPAFKEAAFRVGKGKKAISIKMLYL